MKRWIIGIRSLGPTSSVSGLGLSCLAEVHIRCLSAHVGSEPRPGHSRSKSLILALRATGILSAFFASSILDGPCASAQGIATVQSNVRGTDGGSRGYVPQPSPPGLYAPRTSVTSPARIPTIPYNNSGPASAAAGLLGVLVDAFENVAKSPTDERENDPPLTTATAPLVPSPSASYLPLQLGPAGKAAADAALDSAIELPLATHLSDLTTDFNSGLRTPLALADMIVDASSITKDASAIVGALTDMPGSLRGKGENAMSAAWKAGREELAAEVRANMGADDQDQVINNMMDSAINTFQDLYSQEPGYTGLLGKFRALVKGLPKIILSPLDDVAAQYRRFGSQ